TTTGPSAPAGASLLSPFVVHTYRVFACHHQSGSHVVRKSPSQARANSTPGVAQAVTGCPLDCSWGVSQTPVSTPSEERFRRLRWFAQGSPSWLLPDAFTTPLPQRSLPAPSGPSSLRWFEACARTPASRGLPSSLSHLRTPGNHSYRARGARLTTFRRCNPRVVEVASLRRWYSICAGE